MDRTQFEQERLRVLQEIGRMRQSAPAEAEDLYTALQQVITLGCDEPSCGEWVKEYIKDKDITIRADGIFKEGVLVRNQRAFFHRMHQDYKLFKRGARLKTVISREEISLEFEAMLEEKWHRLQLELRERLSSEPDEELFDRMLRTLTTALVGQHFGPDDIEYKRALGFLAHYFWSVMKIIHDGPKSVLRAGNQAILMLVSSTQKTGKSTTVRHIIGPLDDLGFVWRANFGRLDDMFSYGNLAYNYVAWFDDADRDSAVNMGRFKQIITEDTVSYRGMYSHTEVTLPKLATVIGTSNKSARELMVDSSGLRRFHQIFVNNASVDTGRGIDLDTVISMDMVQMYKSVPLDAESPLLKYLTATELRQYEEEIRPRHVIELWVNDSEFVLAAAEEGHIRLYKDLYDDFRVWCCNNGYRGRYVPTSSSFQHKLLEMGAVRGRKNTGRGIWIKEKA